MPAPEYKRPKSLSACFHKSEYMRAGDLTLFLPWSRTTIDAMIAKGELPAPDLVHHKLRYWRKATMLPAIRSILGVEVDQ